MERYSIIASPSASAADLQHSMDEARDGMSRWSPRRGVRPPTRDSREMTTLSDLRRESPCGRVARTAASTSATATSCLEGRKCRYFAMTKSDYPTSAETTDGPTVGISGPSRLLQSISQWLKAVRQTSSRKNFYRDK